MTAVPLVSSNRHHATSPGSAATAATFTVTFDGLEFSPTVSTIGCCPTGVDPGTVTFTWKTPATSPGAAPAYWISALIPPIFTVTGAVGLGRTAPARLPLEPDGLVWPSPVANSVMNDPRPAGATELYFPSWFRIAAAPDPFELAVNSA